MADINSWCSFYFPVAFRIYDIDQDGFISNGELFQVLKTMVGNNLTEKQLQEIVDKTILYADKDGDGKISYQEFSDVSVILLGEGRSTCIPCGTGVEPCRVLLSTYRLLFLAMFFGKCVHSALINIDHENWQWLPRRFYLVWLNHPLAFWAEPFWAKLFFLLVQVVGNMDVPSKMVVDLKGESWNFFHMYNYILSSVYFWFILSIVLAHFNTLHYTTALLLSCCIPNIPNPSQLYALQ